MTDRSVTNKHAFVTFISLWLKAPEDVQRQVLCEARRLAEDNQSKETKGLSRRVMLAGIAATPAAALPAFAAEKPLSPHDQVVRDAMNLAALMQSIHGGSWGTHVNHECHMVAVTRSHNAKPSDEELHRVIAEDGTITDTWVPGRAGQSSTG